MHSLFHFLLAGVVSGRRACPPTVRAAMVIVSFGFSTFSFQRVCSRLPACGQARAILKLWIVVILAPFVGLLLGIIVLMRSF
jgi:hypothetical protein